jgi:hypothetical protein
MSGVKSEESLKGIKAGVRVHTPDPGMQNSWLKMTKWSGDHANPIRSGDDVYLQEELNGGEGTYVAVADDGTLELQSDKTYRSRFTISKWDTTVVEWVGCFEDDETNSEIKKETEAGHTTKSCAKRCAKYTYFGLQGGSHCWCGDSYNTGTKVTDSQCGYVCHGEHDLSPKRYCGTQKCSLPCYHDTLGPSARNAVYQTPKAGNGQSLSNYMFSPIQSGDDIYLKARGKDAYVTATTRSFAESISGVDLKQGEWNGFSRKTLEQCSNLAIQAGVKFFAYTPQLYFGFCKVLKPSVTKPDLSTNQGYGYKLYETFGKVVQTQTTKSAASKLKIIDRYHTGHKVTLAEEMVCHLNVVSCIKENACKETWMKEDKDLLDRCDFVKKTPENIVGFGDTLKSILPGIEDGMMKMIPQSVNPMIMGLEQMIPSFCSGPMSDFVLRDAKQFTTKLAERVVQAVRITDTDVLHFMPNTTKDTRFFAELMTAMGNKSFSKVCDLTLSDDGFADSFKRKFKALVDEFATDGNIAAFEVDPIGGGLGLGLGELSVELNDMELDTYGQTSRKADCPKDYNYELVEQPTNHGHARCKRSPSLYFVEEPIGILADCPSGYTNMGLTCTRGHDSIPSPSYTPDCPTGYTNTGYTCHRVYSSYTVWSTTADCPPGWTNNGATCGRGSDDYWNGCGSVANCPSGYTNMGWYCLGSWFKTRGMSSMWCHSGWYRSGGRCYRRCRSGYTNTGCTCHRPVGVKSMSHMTCPPGRFKTGARCYTPCKSGYENRGELCARDAHDLDSSYMKCPAGYFMNYITSRCHRNCPSGYTNEGEYCSRHVHTLFESSMTCPEGYEKGLFARCYPKCDPGYMHLGLACVRATSYSNQLECRRNGEELFEGRCYQTCNNNQTNDGQSCTTRTVHDSSSGSMMSLQQCKKSCDEDQKCKGIDFSRATDMSDYQLEKMSDQELLGSCTKFLTGERLLVGKPPTEPNLAWTVTGAHCHATVTDDGYCVHDDNVAGTERYSNHESCTFKWNGPPTTMTRKEFNFEGGWRCPFDWIKVDGTKYCGSNTFPSTYPVDSTKTFTFRSDGSVTGSGWKFCVARKARQESYAKADGANSRVKLKVGLHFKPNICFKEKEVDIEIATITVPYLAKCTPAEQPKWLLASIPMSFKPCDMVKEEHEKRNLPSTPEARSLVQQQKQQACIQFTNKKQTVKQPSVCRAVSQQWPATKDLDWCQKRCTASADCYGIQWQGRIKQGGKCNFITDHRCNLKEYYALENTDKDKFVSKVDYSTNVECNEAKPTNNCRLYPKWIIKNHYYQSLEQDWLVQSSQCFHKHHEENNDFGWALEALGVF